MVAIDKLLQEGQLAESFSMIQAEETYSKMVEHVDTLKANPKLAVKVQLYLSKIVSEYDQEIPQSQTADNLVAPRGRAAQPSRDTRKTN